MYDPILYNALYLIATEPLELSHEKVEVQIRYFKKIARMALAEFHKDGTGVSETNEEAPFNDDF